MWGFGSIDRLFGARIFGKIAYITDDRLIST
jgi:hypothetical protein